MSGVYAVPLAARTLPDRARDNTLKAARSSSSTNLKRPTKTSMASRSRALNIAPDGTLRFPRRSLFRSPRSLGAMNVCAWPIAKASASLSAN